jgi:HD-GYP domain-containing protein (c-di-GMP phosphodiesterase class II)
MRFVKLVPFSAQFLRADKALPFALYDADGGPLLAANQTPESAEQLDSLRGQPLFSDEEESADWMRRLAAALEVKARAEQARPAPDLLNNQWLEVQMELDALLREVREGSAWRSRLAQVHERVRALMAERPDASLYLLVYAAGQTTHKYSSHHALVSCVMCELAAAVLQWPQEEIDALGRAALTMNVAMLQLQDQLAIRDAEITPPIRAQIDAHAEQGAVMLEAAGLDDALVVEVVRAHHDNSQAGEPLDALSPGLRLARLLRRVDIFSAKISRRAKRQPASPVRAAREACLGPDGQPDEIGAALLKAVGMYPPGSFVKLLCGEIGIVVARGERANLPQVAALVSAAGKLLPEPALRDTVERRYGVDAAVPMQAVKVQPPHHRLLALRP